MSSVVMMSTPFQYVVPATSTIPPARLFTAFVDSKNFLPKAVPHIVKSVENIEGNGGPGTIFKITYAEGRPSKLAKERVDAVDHANHTYKYSVIEGDPLGDKLKKISAEIKIDATPDGGSSLNFTCIYEPKDNNSINAEEIQAGKAKTLGLFNAVNAYLSEHPDAYYI